jgi:nucleoside-diphosphate-sugar epimerase
MPILVTGGSGHLGANLVHRLLDEGHPVRVLVRLGSDNRALDGLDVERVYGDLRDPSAMEVAVRGCQRIYHCAAKLSTVGGGEREIFDCNVIGTRNLLRAAAAAGVERVVVTGSFSAVGHLPDRPSDEEVPFYPFEKGMPYEFTKTFVEHECLRAVARGLDVRIATSCAILGPHDYKPSRMGRTLFDFANGRMRAYIHGGFEFVSAHDIVTGHLLAMDKGRTGEKYIFSTEYVTVDQLMALFERITGRPRPRLRLPGPVMMAVASVASPILTRFFPNVNQRLTPGAVRILRMGRRADCSKAKRELGYRPTSVEAAVRAAYRDFVRRGLIEKPNLSALHEPAPAQSRSAA